jgi:hypothetical protein
LPAVAPGILPGAGVWTFCVTRWRTSRRCYEAPSPVRQRRGIIPAWGNARALSLFSVVELVALRRVAPRPAAQRLPANRAVRASHSAAARACAAEAIGQMTHGDDTNFEGFLLRQTASAPRRRGGVVAAQQPLPLNTYWALPWAGIRAGRCSGVARRHGTTKRGVGVGGAVTQGGSRCAPLPWTIFRLNSLQSPKRMNRKEFGRAPAVPRATKLGLPISVLRQ